MKRVPIRYRRRNRKRKRSNYEKLVEGWLKEDGIKYRREAPIGRCHTDFLIGRTAIELNGCYWHHCTECFPNPTPDQRAQRVKDYYRYKFFKSQGYNIVVIKGHEIDNKPEAVREQLRKIGGYK